VRLGDEVVRLGDEAVRVGDEAVRVGDEAARLGDEAARLGDDAVRLGDEAVRLGDQAVRLGDVAAVLGDEALLGGDAGSRSAGGQETLRPLPNATRRARVGPRGAQLRRRPRKSCAGRVLVAMWMRLLTIAKRPSWWGTGRREF
jgi:hypothetical protein